MQSIKQCFRNIVLGVLGAKLIREHGFASFLKPFIDEMKQLEDGIQFTLKGKTLKIPCILVNCAGDMPAMNSMAGFKESSPRTNRPCRVCLIRRRELDFIHSNEECMLRNKKSHEEQLEHFLTQSDQRLREDASKEYGMAHETFSSRSNAPPLRRNYQS